MKTALAGVGATGILSTVAFTLFYLGQHDLSLTDILDTTVLMGLAFGGILAVGLATMAKTLGTGKTDAVASGTDWAKTCPHCGAFIRRRRSFCPTCGADLV